MRPPPSAIKITDAAAERFKSLLVKHDQPPAGLRIGVKAKGCSGLSYVIDYADEKGPNDEVVQDKGVTIFIDPRATMFIIGSEVDYVEDKLQSGFVFRIRTKRAAAAAASCSTSDDASIACKKQHPGRRTGVFLLGPENAVVLGQESPTANLPHASARRHVQYRKSRHRPQVSADRGAHSHASGAVASAGR